MAPSEPGRSCPTCGTTVPSAADICPRCGMPAASRRSGVGEADSAARGALSRRKGSADLLFLAGLLLGGPVMTVGGRVQLGLFLVLAGALASALRRYSQVSLGGAVALGAASAALVAAVFLDPAEPGPTAELGPEGRAAYVAELAEEHGPDGRVEARGPGLITVWFFLPEQRSGTCGTVPEAPVRNHLAELGFRRIVVADRSEAGSVCSFEP